MSPEPTPVQGNEVPEESSITQTGSVTARTTHGTIHCITIVGQIEGHMEAPQATKTTKYEHIIPQITAVEEAEDIDGLLVLLNTVGGDVEAGLAIAELIAGMRKPTVSLVLGGGHSIRRPARGRGKAVVYCAVGSHDHSSGAHERHRDCFPPDLRLFPLYPGAYHGFCHQPFPHCARCV